MLKGLLGAPMLDDDASLAAQAEEMSQNLAK